MKIRKSISSFAIALIALGLGFASSVNHAAAAVSGTLEWVVYDNTGPGFEGDVIVTVDDTAGTAKFEFTNDSTGDSSNSSIGTIFFEDGWVALIENPTDLSSVSGGPTLEEKTTGLLLPTGIVPDASNAWVSSEFVFGRTGNKGTGIETGEDWMVTFDIITTFNLLGVLGTDGEGDILGLFLGLIVDQFDNFRIAAHVLACDIEVEEIAGSCGVYAQPIPPAILLFVSALMGLGGFGYRRRRAAAA